MNKIIIAIVVLLFTGCGIATTSSTLKFAESNYINKNIDDLIFTIGTPVNQYVMDNGDIMYQFEYKGVLSLPVTTVHNGYGSMYGYGNYSQAYVQGTSTTYGGISERECKITVLATNDKIIKKILIKRDTMGTQPLTASMCAQMFGIN